MKKGETLRNCQIFQINGIGRKAELILRQAQDDGIRNRVHLRLRTRVWSLDKLGMTDFLCNARRTGGVEEVAEVVDELELDGLGGNGGQHEARDSAAEETGAGRLDGAVFGAGARDDKIEVSDLEVLEVVIVTGEVGVDLVLLKERQDMLDDFGLVSVGDTGGIDRMMTHDEFPLGGGGNERLFEPAELLGGILTRDVGGDQVVISIGDDEGAGVDVEDFELGGRVDGVDLRIIAGRHVPAGMQFGILELGVAVGAVVVVTEDDVPGDLQRRSSVDVLEGFLELGIGGGGDAGFVEIIAEGDDKACGGIFAGDAHLRGDLHLVRATVAAPVADDGEVESLSCGVSGAKRFGDNATDERGLRGDEEGADEIAAGERHRGNCGERK